MRPYEQVTVEVKTEANTDFGTAAPEWEHVTKQHATIKHNAGRLTRSGDQLVPTHDEEITIRYQRDVHVFWQKKRPLRIVDAFGDTYGVESLSHIRGTRVEWLQLGCKRG